MGVMALSNTIHFYARLDAKHRLLGFFTDVLGLQVRPVMLPYVKGSPEPMYAVEFSNGSRMSVEFTADAEQLRQQALAFGLKRIVHPYTPFFYIQAPGGQVFRIVNDEAT